MSDYDVVIIGGGCAGIFLASELSKRNWTCAVLHKNPAASHASTRNQGWLQSGSFYAAFDDTGAALECRAGHEYITATYPDLVHTSVPSYSLFGEKGEFEAALRVCDVLDIRMRELEIGQIHQLLTENPILEDTPFSYVAETSDRAFDTHRLLQRVADQAAERGAVYCEVPSMASINPEPSGNGWRIALSDDQIHGKILVLACGPYIPEMLQQFIPEEAQGMKVTKTPVLVIRNQVSNCAFMAPLTAGAPNIVPFGRSHGIEGVSVCMSRVDYAARDATDDDVENLPGGINIRDAFGKMLQLYCPGIERLAVDGEVAGHFYACQKIKMPSRGAHIRFFTFEGRPLSVF